MSRKLFLGGLSWDTTEGNLIIFSNLLDINNPKTNVFKINYILVLLSYVIDDDDNGNLIFIT